MANKPQKIVVARYRFIGDTLLTVPFLRALRHQNPEAEIHLLIGQDGYPLMRECPYIDQAIAFEPRKLGFWKATKQIQQQHYDCAYVLKRSFSSALMMRLAGIPDRIGFDTEHRGFLLTRRVPYREKTQHEAQCFLDLLPQTPRETPDLHLETWLPDSVLESAKGFLQETTGAHIALHVTSDQLAKTWPIRHFQALAEMLVSEYNASLYCLGIASEWDVGEDFRQGVSDAVKAQTVNLCGKTDLLESLALLKHLDLVVANDSGLVHMAAAVNTPLVALFGPMDPNQWRPLSENATVLTHPDLTCQPCRMKITCNQLYPCMTEITPQQVMEVCRASLKS